MLDVIAEGVDTHAAAVAAAAVAVRALKLAEAGEEVIVRLQELHGAAVERVTVRAGGGLVAAREVDGAEQARGDAEVESGALVTALCPYQPRAFALRLDAPAAPCSPPRALPLELPFDLDVVSRNGDRGDGDFDGHGRSLPGELLPAELDLGGVPFRFGATEPGARNALSCRGQRLELPAGFRRLHLVAAATAGPAQASFEVGGQMMQLEIAPWDGVVGEWGRPPRRDEVAWAGSHRHSPRGDEPYVFCYLYRYVLDLPAAAAASELVLPTDRRVRILAITLVAADDGAAVPATPLYD